MVRSTEIFLFGDLTVSFEEELRQLVHIKDQPLLRALFERAAFALREEISKLPAHQQVWFPRFTTLLDILPNITGKHGAPALKFALLCLCEIGLFISHQVEESRPYPTPDSSSLLGICTGSFATAAIASSRSVSELIPAGIEATIVAFRTATLSLLHRNDISNSIDPHEKSWSAIVNASEADATKLVESFSIEKTRSPASKLFVSAVSLTNVTISGPPSVLNQFLTETKLQSRRLPIESPYHAPHLFPLDVSARAVKDFHDTALESYQLRIPVLAATGGQMKPSTFRDALSDVVSQTLRFQVRWDKIVESCRELLQEMDVTDCKVLPVLSNAHQLLSASIAQGSNIRSQVEDGVTSSSPRPSISTGKFEQSKIAIIGFSGRFPDAASNEEFWQLLRDGRDVHRTIPEDRFDWKAHFDSTGKTRNTSRVQYGCFIREPGLFDTRFFNMSPREAESTDPAQRLLITATYEALEMAGFVPNRTPSSQVDRVGVFMGTTSDDWREVNSGQNVDTYFIPGGNRAFVPGRISYFFKFSGPSLSVDTACSSSFSAIHTACTYLWKGDCDTAVAGGTNILTNPDNFAGLDRGHFLSTTGNCNAFDDGANGYCRADAVGSVILKRYEDAVADNDPIFGIIGGAHTNHCGQAESITRPHEGDQASVFNRILRNANQNPLDVSYVEMHGTGTQAGDATEMNSVLSCFVPEKQRMPHYPLHLGSAKANIGHAESASGVSSLIKVLLMMKNDEIPPHCGIKTKINHNYPLDLKDRNVNIAMKPTQWIRDDCISGKRTAFLNNFSAAGGNTAILLEDGPLCERNERQRDPRTTHPIAITAKSAKALQGNVEALLAFLDSHPDIPASSLSYTTTARRIQHAFRVMISGKDSMAISSSLRKKLEDLSPKPIPNAVLLPKVAFVFTGQGALYAGIGKELFESITGFRSDILRFDGISQRQGFPSFLSVIDGSASEEEAAQPAIAHVGHTCIQMALCNLWRTWGVQASLVVGHSLGEYAAFYAAGITSAADTIYLVGTRAHLLSTRCSPGSHSMVAVKASQSKVEDQACRSSCEVACVNQPDGTVLSGCRQEIDIVTEKLEDHGHKCVKLDIPYAFHSAQVEPILEDFERSARSVRFSKPSVPFLSPLLGSVITEAGSLGSSYLTQACRRTVNFEGALKAAKAASSVGEKTIWLELGPHPLCSGMIKATLGSQAQTVPSLQKRSDAWATIVVALEHLYTQGIDIHWNEYHRDFASCHQVLELPRYNWELRNYWIPYRNNFCLTKGDPTDATVPESKANNSGSESIITPAVQRIIEVSKDNSTMVVESDINHPALAAVIQGHKVNGAALCPSSLYADAAMTVVDQMLRMQGMSTETISLDVANMRVEKPLVANGSQQLLRISASTNWGEHVASLTLYSVDSKGKKLADHATCQVRITEGAPWKAEWSRISFLINSRLDALEKSVDDGTAHKMKSGIVYKLFSSLVDYSSEYRGMQEVILDSGELEAVAKVSFQSDDNGYYLNPQWIDSLGHIAGFIMNGNDSVVSKDSVFVNHGWDGMQIFTKFSRDKVYRSYNKMQLASNNLYVGNTYILEDAEIVAVFYGVKFQGVPRRVLDQLLPPVSGARQPAAKMTPKPSAAKEASSTKSRANKTPESRRKPVSPPLQTRSDSSKPQSTVAGQILKIIAEEAGADVGDLKDDTSFDECGIDSLLSLNISNRVQEELSISVDSSIFVECPAVGSFLKRLAGEAAGDGVMTSAPESTVPSSPESDSLFDESISSSVTSEEEVTEVVDKMETTTSNPMAVIKAVIAEEVGLEAHEVGRSTSFDELGVDSLLSLNIMNKLEEVLDMEMPKSLLIENQTIDDIEKCLGLSPTKKTAKTVDKTPGNAAGDPGIAQAVPTSKSLDSPPRATSHLLQGSPKTATKKLFLFPDGSGSAFSYAALSSISPSVAVYGLSCPWMKDPWSMSEVTFSDLSTKFLHEIRRLQPSGPYYLGGWSAGGISAYDAARQLSISGADTARLILLDSPNPIGLENPPQRMYDFFDQLDFFGMQGKKPPAWLRAHFDAFLNTLDNYTVEPWQGANPPQTHIVYAKDGICKSLKPDDPRPEIRPGDPREMLWLLNDRTDFSGAGWRALVGEGNLTVDVVEDVNHFSLVADGPRGEQLAAFIKNAMGV